LDVKKRFTEEQIIGFLREADRGVAVKKLCRKYGFIGGAVRSNCDPYS
jgi:putative transposase